MHIASIDEANDLFEIKNVISKEVMDELSKVDLLSLKTTSNPGQEHWNRVAIDIDSHPVFNKILDDARSHKDDISKAVGKKITSLAGRFWLDYEGFTVYPHVDASGVDLAFQLYLTDLPYSGTRFFTPDPNDMYEKNDNQKWHWMPGSKTYSDKDPMLPIRSIPRKKFRCVANTGYIMINHPAQLHSVPVVLKKGELRLSAYFSCVT